MVSFAAKLGKVKLFIGASVGFGSGNSSSAEKEQVSPRLALGSVPTGGQGAFGEVGAPSFVEVMRSEASPSATVEFPMVWLEDPLGKDHFSIGNPLGKTSDTKQSSSVWGNVACLSDVAVEEDGRLLERGTCDLFFRRGRVISRIWRMRWIRPCILFLKAWRSLGLSISPTVLDGIRGVRSGSLA